MKDQISQEKKDKQGNALTIMVSGNVFLKLFNKGTRRIGYIDRANKVFITERKRAEHLFRKMNAYGFNEHLITKAKSFDMIRVEDDFCTYEFPLSLLREHGKTHLHFKEQGFELQLFLPLEYLDNYIKPIKKAEF